jgi:predicted small metal-binding protein
MPSNDEHIIRCSECGRDLIVKDIVNNGVAFLSHLKNDHGITYIPQRMTETKTERIKQG